MVASPSVAGTGATGAIAIDGLRAFSRALKAVEGQYPAQVRQANYDLANEISVRSKAKAGSVGGVARKAAQSLRAYRSLNQSVVAGGGAKYPFFWGAEFGAIRYHQFKPWRGNQWQSWSGGPGYFLHPTIRENAQTLIDDYMKRLDEIHREAFPL